MKLNKGAVLRLMESQGTLLTAKQLRGLLGLKKSQSPKLKAWLRKQVEKGTLVQQGVRFGSTRLLEHAPEVPSEEEQSSRGAKFQSSRGKTKHRTRDRRSGAHPRSLQLRQGRFERRSIEESPRGLSWHHRKSDQSQGSRRPSGPDLL